MRHDANRQEPRRRRATPSPCGGWSSTTARPRRWTASTWTCGRAPSSGCSGPTAPARPPSYAPVHPGRARRRARHRRRLRRGAPAPAAAPRDRPHRPVRLGRREAPRLGEPLHDRAAARPAPQGRPPPRRRAAGAVLAHRGRQAAGDARTPAVCAHSWSENRFTTQLVFVSGYCCCRRRAIVSICAWAAASVPPGFRRPITDRKWAPRSARAASKAIGTRTPCACS